MHESMLTFCQCSFTATERSVEQPATVAVEVRYVRALDDLYRAQADVDANGRPKAAASEVRLCVLTLRCSCAFSLVFLAGISFTRNKLNATRTPCFSGIFGLVSVFNRLRHQFPCVKKLCTYIYTVRAQRYVAHDARGLLRITTLSTIDLALQDRQRVFLSCRHLRIPALAQIRKKRKLADTLMEESGREEHLEEGSDEYEEEMLRSQQAKLDAFNDTIRVNHHELCLYETMMKNPKCMCIVLLLSSQI
jgi:hypothetical protein